MMTPEDIKRINYIYYTSYRQFVKRPHNLLVCYLLYFLHLIKEVLCLNFKYTKIGKVLFFIPSVNNKKSVKTILNNLKIDDISKWESSKNDLPHALFYIKSLSGLKVFQELYTKSSNDEKRLIRQFYKIFMTTYGVYKTIDCIFRNNPQLKLVVLSNDHILISRCLIELAGEKNIKTLYVQHASITERFPPLHFTYSFLDGMESYEKYKAIGDIRGRVFLSGSPRFDEMYQYKSAEKKYDVGIALNMRDSCDKVLELCNYIQDNYSTRIIVRPHPRMGKLFNAYLFSKNGIDISDSTTESSFSFLSKLKFLVANESSIHLDSALIGVPSLLYNFSEENVLDWYSYIKKGMIKVCDKLNDVLLVIKDQQGLPADIIQYYNASFGTQIEGNVGAFIASFITTLLSSSEQEAINEICLKMDNTNDYFAIRNN